MKDFKEIGLIHSFFQIVACGIYLGEVIFLLPLALAEITGWVMLGLWTGLNFIVLPLVINILEGRLVKKGKAFTSKAALCILLTGVIGGLISFSFYLVDYAFHMVYIGKAFEIKEYPDDFLSIFCTMAILIAFGESMRKIWLQRKSQAK